MKIILIGYGYWGKKIFQTLHKITEEEIIVFDKIVTPEAEVEIHKIEEFDGFLNTLEKGKGFFFIATPEHTHYALAKKILLCGQNVFVEKPLCLKHHQALELVKIAKNNSCCVFVDRIFLYDEVYQLIKSTVMLGAIGSITNVSSIRHSNNIYKPNLSVIEDLVPHDIYLLKDLMNVYPIKTDVEIIKKEGNQLIEVNLSWEVKGCIWQNWYSWNTHETERTLQITGTYGSILWKKGENGDELLLTKGIEEKKHVFQKKASSLELIIKDFFQTNSEENLAIRDTRYESYIHEIAVLESIRVQSSTL